MSEERKPLEHLIERARRTDRITVFGVPLQDMSQQELIGVVHMLMEQAEEARKSSRRIQDMLARRRLA
jgi:hypothetical protein